jgi:hypothetical protein
MKEGAGFTSQSWLLLLQHVAHVLGKQGKHVLLGSALVRPQTRPRRSFQESGLDLSNHVGGGCCGSIYRDLIFISPGFQSAVGTYVQPISEARPRQQYVVCSRSTTC